MNDAYRYLKKQFSRLSSLEDAIGLLGWDKEVMMPLGAGNRRSDNLATLDGLYHEILSDPSIGEKLSQADPGQSNWDQANLREMRQAYRNACALPEQLIEESSLTSAQCEMAWRDALTTGDFSKMLPIFRRVVELTQQKAARLGDKFGLDPYDALLDSFEPGLRQDTIDPLFSRLSAILPSLINDVLQKQEQNPPLLAPSGPFSEDKQKALGQHLMTQLGFDLNYGRLDTSIHPFCGGARNDIRLTTRYTSSDFLTALMGIIHETGHALYDLGLPKDWTTQPVGQAGGMLIHESQSLFMEMQIARSREFLHWLAPQLHDYFGPALSGYNDRALYREVTHVQPGFIRVDADEVTYPAHILLRYRLEKALIHGELSVDDLPHAFNEGFHELLGLTVKDNRQGCWQDIHWPEGLFGYFPCYTLGAFAAAQFKEKAFEALPSLPDAIKEGDFTSLRNWLRENIHSQGRRYDTFTLIKKVTGHTLQLDPWLEHIKNRYL